MSVPLLTSIAQTKPELIYAPDFNPACALIAKQAQDIAGLVYEVYEPMTTRMLRGSLTSIFEAPGVPLISARR